MIQGSLSGSKQFSHPFKNHNDSISNGKFILTTSKDITSCSLKHGFLTHDSASKQRSMEWSPLWRFSDVGSLESLTSLEELQEKRNRFITKQSSTAWLY